MYKFRPSTIADRADPLDLIHDVTLKHQATIAAARLVVSDFLASKHYLTAFQRDRLWKLNNAPEIDTLIQYSANWTPKQASDFLILLGAWYTAHDIDTIVPILVEHLEPK